MEALQASSHQGVETAAAEAAAVTMSKEQESSSSGLPSALALIVSLLTHVLLLAPVLYIVGLAFDSYSFFSWHPICMSLGAGLLIVEGVFAITGEAFASKKLTRANRVTLHWILHLLGLILLTCGLTIIIVNKNDNNREHFTSTHGVLGLVTFVICWLVACFGIVANNAQWLYPKVRPVLVKVVHAFGGIGLTVLLLATVINGTYNVWWLGIGASETGRSLVLASFVVAAVLVLVKPIIGAAARTRVLMRPPPSVQRTTNSS